jgi:hypothetical protein
MRSGESSRRLAGFLHNCLNIGDCGENNGKEGKRQGICMHEKKECIVCRQKRERGIHILNRFLCDDCEKEIIESDSSHILYTYLVWRMRFLIHQDAEKELHG